MVQAEPDERYREQWPTATADPDREQRVSERRIALPKRLVLGLFALLPWLLYCGLVFTAWWLIIFDGDSSTDGLGWGLLALALPCLFVAAQVSKWQRRWIRARFELELWTRRPSGGGGLLDWLDWP